MGRYCKFLSVEYFRLKKHYKKQNIEYYEWERHTTWNSGMKNGSLVKPNSNIKERNEIQPEMNLKLSL